MHHTIILFATAALTVQLSSCMKHKIDTPPDMRHYDPALPITHTLTELKAMNGFYDFKTGGDTTLITEDITIAGIVTADDRTGNFYKRIVIEDSTGAIAVLLDAYNLYNDYPEGRRVYIKCKDLYLGYDGGLPVIGYTPAPQLSLTGIPAVRIQDHVVKGSTGHHIEGAPYSLTQIADADPALYNRLITITEAEFTDTGVSYTQPNATTNREISNCTGSKLAVRSSNYASFAGAVLPAGKGTITGIYTVYTSAVSGGRTPQLVIRSTNDVQFHDPRCHAGAAPIIPLVTIDSIRRLANPVGTVSLDNYKISGVVISDRRFKNTDARNMIIQEGNRGIVVRFSGAHTFDAGDSVLVDISGAQLSYYNGLLQVNGNSFRTQKAERIATGRAIVPETYSVAVINSEHFTLYQSTLVRIMGAMVSEGVYAGNKSLTDASDISGRLKLYTASGATFAQQQIPPGEVNITGIVGQFGNTRQISIRSTADVE